MVHDRLCCREHNLMSTMRWRFNVCGHTHHIADLCVRGVVVK